MVSEAGFGKRLGQIRAELIDRYREAFTDRKGRVVLIAKARWLLLFLVSLYGLAAGGLLAFSRFGLTLTPSQAVLLSASILAVLSYNSLCYFWYDRVGRFRYLEHLQIVLDLFFVTVLIHISGGAASWFWPVYLVVTMEAAILLEGKREVCLLGATGGALYGALLVAEHEGLLEFVQMPFVDKALYQDPVHLVLMWLWVAILNASFAIIAAFLMSVIRRENRAFHQSQSRLSNFLDSANDLIFSFTPTGEFLYVNEAWRKSLGYDLPSLSELQMLDIVHPDYRTKCLIGFRKVVNGQEADPIEGYFVAKDGELVAVEGNITCSFQDGMPIAIWGICRDITERKMAQEKLHHLAHHDMLTGLPNRLLCIDRLKHAVALAKRMKKHGALLFLDLDRFKIINDTLGHGVGDKLLQETAERLSHCVREVDTVARLGGDEFTVTLVNLNGPEDAEKVARKILRALAKPLLIQDHELFITTSIGICMFPEQGDEVASLVKKADVAMYHAKSLGRNNFQFYDPELDFDSDRRLKMESGLRKALEGDEFFIHYQPKVDMVTGKVTALEALLRWEHPELGVLPPTEFISLAEEAGLIVPIGEWVLRKACEQNRLWQEQGLAPVRVAVNLSGYQLQQKGLIDTIQRILAETDLEPRFLELEVTETVIMQNPEFAVAILNQIRDLGVHIAIDDFGTGYSSLAHLKRFSVNTLKIDKSFVKDVEKSATDAAIATAIIAMGNSLDLRVIAEGVETSGQYTFLRDHRCDEVQGYLFSRPVPPEEVADILQDNRFITALARSVEENAAVGSFQKG